MSKIKYINNNNFIDKIKVFQNYKAYKIAYDYNFENKEFISKLSSMLFTDKKLYTSDEFEKVLRYANNKLNNEIFYGNDKVKHKSYYIIFYTGRGWSTEVAKEKVLSIKSLSHPIFFSKDEILQYLKTTNNYDINLNNNNYITTLLNYIFMPYGNINIGLLYKQLCTFWASWYPEMENNSRGYITTTPYYWIARGYNKDEAQQIIKNNSKKHTILGLEFYKNKGIPEDDAKQIISNLLKNNAAKSKGTKKYWLNLGLPEEIAIQKANEYSILKSVWSKQYWLNLGYSEEEAKLKCLEYNGSSSLCKKYKNDISKFYLHLLNFSNNIKNRYIEHRQELYNEKDNDKKIKLLKIGYGKISKSEEKCFKILKDEVDSEILHKPYIVSFPDDFISLQNKVCYICDGYLKYKGMYIIFEYDGGIGKYHDEDVDKIKSKEILLIDENVLGIIRIHESLFKNYKLLIQENGLINIFKNAIDKIKSGNELLIILK